MRTEAYTTHTDCDTDECEKWSEKMTMLTAKIQKNGEIMSRLEHLSDLEEVVWDTVGLFSAQAENGWIEILLFVFLFDLNECLVLLKQGLQS